MFKEGVMSDPPQTPENATPPHGGGAANADAVRPEGVPGRRTRAFVIPLILGALAIGAVLLVGTRHPPGRLASADRALVLGSDGPVQEKNSDLMNRTFDLSRLNADGLRKCQAFKSVVAHAREMQSAFHGEPPAGPAARLQLEMNAARALSPKALTPLDCGVPL